MILPRRLLLAAIGATAVASAALFVASASADPQPERRVDMSGVMDAGARPSPIARANARPHGPPDPVPPFAEARQYVFDLKWQRGDVYLLGVRRVDLGAPQKTPRVMGRFALELFEGPTLIERVRFDFPMLGAVADDADAGRGARPLDRGLTTRIGVMFPATTHGTRLELLDRATERRWTLPWPPPQSATTNVDAPPAQPDGGTMGVKANDAATSPSPPGAGSAGPVRVR